MTKDDFLDKCLLLDLETDGSKLYHIGAVYSGQTFERKGRFDLQAALKDLDHLCLRFRLCPRPQPLGP